MAKHWKMIDGVMKYVDDGQDTQQTQPVQQQTPVQNANNAEKIANDSAVNNAVQNTPVATNTPNQDNTSIAVGQPQQTVAPQVEQPATLTPLQQAQKAYDDAVAKQQEVNNAQIKSYQDIIDRYGAPETAEQAQAREAKDRRKRNLLGLIQLGSNIGNMINATTGGHMGERSVEQPNLVGAYDQARNTELTHRMKRDEKRNAARQAMINQQAQGANAGVNRAFQTYSQAVKGEQLEKQQQAKADLEKFKADKAEKLADKKIASSEKIAANRDKVNMASINERGRHNRAVENTQKIMQEIKQQELELKKSNGGRGTNNQTIPVSVEGEDKPYDVPKYVLDHPHIVEELVSCMPPEYKSKIYDGMTIAEMQKVISDYARDKSAHSGEYEEKGSDGKSKKVNKEDLFTQFKEVLEVAGGKKEGINDVVGEDAPDADFVNMGNYAEKEDDGVGDSDSYK